MHQQHVKCLVKACVCASCNMTVKSCDTDFYAIIMCNSHLYKITKIEYNVGQLAVVTIYAVGVYIVYYHCAISFGDRQNLTETLWRSYRNRTVILQSLCNLHNLHTEIAPCPKSHDAHVMPLLVPYNYLKGLQSFLGPKNDYLKSCVVLTISVQCLYGDHAINLRCVYRLWDFDFSKFVMHSKGDLDIVRAWQTHRKANVTEA